MTYVGRQRIIKVYRDARGEWRWQRVAPNGRIIAESGEGYHNRTDCLAMASEQFPEDEVVTLEPHSVTREEK